MSSNGLMSSPLAKVGVRYPIIQAPMAGTSTPALAASVSNAGGLGSIGMGSLPLAQARKMIEETKSLTDKPFNVNLFVHQPPRIDLENEKRWLEYLKPHFEAVGSQIPERLEEGTKSFVENEEMQDLILELSPPVVSFHFGLPSEKIIQKLKGKGCVLLASATNEAEARRIQEAGIDMVIAQGVEAGGHSGSFNPGSYGYSGIPVESLVKILLQTVSIPVIAAGGIMNGTQGNYFMEIGCAAVQLGTAFILCPESAADQGFRKALKSDAAKDTAHTYLISGRPARGIKNKWAQMDRIMIKEADFDQEGNEPKIVQPSYPIAYDAQKALHSAAKKKGIDDYGAHWAGSNASMAREMPAAEMLKLLVEEMKAAKEKKA